MLKTFRHIENLPKFIHVVRNLGKKLDNTVCPQKGSASEKQSTVLFFHCTDQ